MMLKNDRAEKAEKSREISAYFAFCGRVIFDRSSGFMTMIWTHAPLSYNSNAH